MLTENFAHSGYQVNASNRTVAPQLYRDHIHAVRNNALREFDRRFRHYKNRKMVNFYRKILETATEWHDLGKLMPECQAILSQSSESDTSMLNHVDAGVSHCIKEYERTNELYYLLAAWLILAHHIGYIDWEELTKITLVNPSQMLSPTKIHLKEKWRDYRIRDYVDANLIIWEQLHKEDIIITDSMPDVGYNINIKNVDWHDISECFSCMVSADHADTNQFRNDGYVLPEPYKLREDERIENFDKYNDGLSKINPGKRIKDRKLLYASADRESISSWIKNDGTVGSGKTNANHKKALKMAKKYGCERIFIVAPYINVINQLVGKAKESLLLPGEYQVGVINEHHSMVQFTDWRLRKYNNRLDGPLTYTTCVQFFEALTTYHPAAIGKLIHFTDSVIVLDEYHQAMPYELWSHALFLLEKLVNNYNVHVIFSSGTPIDFWDLYHKNIVVDNMLTHTEWKHFQARENTRVKKSHLGAIGLGKLCRHITNGYKNKHSTLIVCNTTNNAKVLFKLLNSGNGNVYHLSSRVTPEFREKRLELIKQKIKDELPVILIATSMVECGIDISFERCYREETSLDSLQQCTGRCNRNNEFKIGKVYVFCFSESLIRKGTITINPTTQRAINVFRKLEKNEWIPAMGTSAARDTLTTSNWNMISRIEDNFSKGNLRTVGNLMRLIKTQKFTVVIDPTVIERIKSKDITLGYADISRNSVTVFGNVHQRLLNAGIIEPLEKIRDDADDPITMWALNNYHINYDIELGLLC